MTDDLEVFLSDGFRLSVEACLDRDPLRIALDGRVLHAAALATQVKYLKRAESKLPSYYAARCILPPLAFEQSSSEVTAARKGYSGGVAIDLTCGLGVDAFYLAKRFERVIAVECDPLLAAVARENFRRLGADNIEVVCVRAGEFLSGGDIRADLVYADPDRRSARGRKMVLLEDCSPDIAALLPRIREVAPRLAVKLSPLFDVDEALRVFGRGTRVEVVSSGGECKEIIAEVTFPDPTALSTAPPPASVVCAVAIGLGEAEYLLDADRSAPVGDLAPSGATFEPHSYGYIIVPDVALQKARLARRYFSERGVWIDSDNGYGFSAEKPEAVMGKIYEIASVEPFDPKELKRRLRALNIKSIDILKRDFPLSSADLSRQLGVREGGKTAIAFTRAAGRLWQIVIK